MIIIDYICSDKLQRFSMMSMRHLIWTMVGSDDNYLDGTVSISSTYRWSCQSSRGLVLMFTIIQILIMWWKWSSFRRGCSIHVALHFDSYEHVDDVHFAYRLCEVDHDCGNFFSINIFTNNFMNVAHECKKDCSGRSQQRIGMEQVTFPSFVICFIAFVDVSSKNMVRKFYKNFRTSTPPLSLFYAFCPSMEIAKWIECVKHETWCEVIHFWKVGECLITS